MKVDDREAVWRAAEMGWSGADAFVFRQSSTPVQLIFFKSSLFGIVMVPVMIVIGSFYSNLAFHLY